MSQLHTLPSVDRIQGAILQGDRTPQGSQVVAQYTDHKGEWFEVQMSFLDAMYLLNILRGIQEDIGYVMPDDPFAPQ